MSLLLMIFILLSVSCMLWIVLSGWKIKDSHNIDHVRLNTRYYQQRLQELASEHRQGVVAEQQPIINELQYRLLNDTALEGRSLGMASGRAILGLASGLLIVVAVLLYGKTGSLLQWGQWQQDLIAYPQLRQHIVDPAASPLTLPDLILFDRGLKADLQDDPGDADNWMMLARLSRVLRQNQVAKQAFIKAMTLVPDNQVLQREYIQFLLTAGRSDEQHQAELLLTQQQKNYPRDPDVLDLLAIQAYNQQRPRVAIQYWQQALRYLPRDSARAAKILLAITQVEKQEHILHRSLTVTRQTSTPSNTDSLINAMLTVIVRDGQSGAAIAIKKLPVDHFPVTLSLDDSNGLFNDPLLSAQPDIQVEVLLDETNSQRKNHSHWAGKSSWMSYRHSQQINIQLVRQNNK